MESDKNPILNRLATIEGHLRALVSRLPTDHPQELAYEMLRELFEFAPRNETSTSWLQ